MPIKKKIKKSSVTKDLPQPKKKGMKNFSLGGFEKSPFQEASKVKNYKELEVFVKEHLPSLGASGVAYAATKFVHDNYNTHKIMYDPNCYDAVFDLFDAIKIKNDGAVGVWNVWKNNPFFNRALAKFSLATGYAPPRTSKTFQEHIGMFKAHFGLKRKKKKVPQFRD